MPIPDIIRKFLREFPDVGDCCFYAGFSGGADSTALVVALQEAGLNFTAVHFEHGIRGEASVADAQWCESFCRQRQIPFLRYDLAVPAHLETGESCEDGARRLRLECWQKLGEAHKAAIFLAHHADDNLENLFLRLARGGNATGLTGLRLCRHWGNLLLCRPLLSCRKADLEDYLRQHGIEDWRIDATNEDSAYRRNAIRNELLPLWRRIFDNDSGLLRSIEALSADSDYLEGEADRAFASLQSIDDWQALPDAIFARVLRRWLAQERKSGDLPLDRNTIEQIRQAVMNYQGGVEPVAAGGGLIIDVTADGLTAHYALAPLPPRVLPAAVGAEIQLPELGRTLKITANPLEDAICRERFAAKSFGAKGELLVRSWRNGDKIRPFGADYQQKLQDVFTDMKIAGNRRNGCPVVEINGEIIWVAGAKRAEFGRVAPGDDEIWLNLL